MRLFRPVQDVVDALLAELRIIGDSLQKQRKTESEDQQSGEESKTPPYTQPIVDISEVIRSTSASSETNERRYQNRNLLVSIAGVVAVIAYTTVAALQGCIMHRTYREIKAQTAAAQDAANAAATAPPRTIIGADA